MIFMMRLIHINIIYFYSYFMYILTFPSKLCYSERIIFRKSKNYIITLNLLKQIYKKKKKKKKKKKAKCFNKNILILKFKIILDSFNLIISYFAYLKLIFLYFLLCQLR